MVLVGDADRNTVTCRPTSRRERERAFTLIEMLVVMVVIGILTAIAIPTYAAQKANARKAKVLIQMRTFQRAVESCAGDSYDETYFGCLGQNELASEVDRALDQIPWVEGPNPNEPEGSVDVDGIKDDGLVWKAPNARIADGSRPDQYRYKGYVITSWLKIGEQRIWFSIVRDPDGSLRRECGPLPASGHASSYAAPQGFPPRAGEAVPGSKICLDGRWS